VNVLQRPGANALATTKEIKREMDDLQKEFPKASSTPSIQPHRVHRRQYRRAGKDDLRSGAPGGHRDSDLPAGWRASIIPILAIPVSR